MRSFLSHPKAIVWSLGVILLIVVILQNVERTSVHFLFWSLPEMPKLVLILLSMAVGSLLTLLVVWEIRHGKNNSP